MPIDQKKCQKSVWILKSRNAIFSKVWNFMVRWYTKYMSDSEKFFSRFYQRCFCYKAGMKLKQAEMFKICQKSLKLSIFVPVLKNSKWASHRYTRGGGETMKKHYNCPFLSKLLSKLLFWPNRDMFSPKIPFFF